MKECDIFRGVKTYSDPSYIFSESQGPQPPRIYACGLVYHVLPADVQMLNVCHNGQSINRFNSNLAAREPVSCRVVCSRPRLLFFSNSQLNVFLASLFYSYDVNQPSKTIMADKLLLCISADSLRHRWALDVSYSTSACTGIHSANWFYHFSLPVSPSLSFVRPCVHCPMLVLCLNECTYLYTF